MYRNYHIALVTDITAVHRKLMNVTKISLKISYLRM